MKALLFFLMISLSFSAKALESKILAQGDIDYCIEMSSIAGHMMKLRQNGESFGSMYKVDMGDVLLTKAMRAMVVEVFNAPVFKSQTDKDKVEIWFKEKMVSSCIKKFEKEL